MKVTNEFQNLLSLWHQDCLLCDAHLKNSRENPLCYKALWVSEWYSKAIQHLLNAIGKACRLTDTQFPPYYPGRHWLEQFNAMWMQLFPNTDSSTHNQVCADLLTLHKLDIIFSEDDSTDIEELQHYLIDNQETARNIFIRILEIMNETEEVLDEIRGGKMKEIPEEDGSFIYYFGKTPKWRFLGQQETELQKELRKTGGYHIAHLKWTGFPDQGQTSYKPRKQQSDDVENHSEIDR